MATTKGVVDQIWEVEGFEVSFLALKGDDRKIARRRVEDYPYTNAANRTWTAAKWRAMRFEPNYPDFGVDVLDGDGKPVHGKTLLTTVRDSYEVDPEERPEPKGADSPGSEHKPGRSAPPGAHDQAPPAPGSFTLADLESRLWAAANSLRGPVDPADFKSYVFPLLFLKWVSDTWDLDHAAAVADFGEEVSPVEEADYHRFAVPDGCHWSDLRQVSVNVGVTLQNILQRLEEANPKSLAGIFGDVAWANKERLPETALLNLIDAFDRMVLNRNVVSNDMLGAAYEYLLRQFADESGKKAGEFFTPRAVVRLLMRILDPQPGESVYDPACGSGGMLVETINEVREAGGDTRTLRLYGQEVNLTTAAIARMNLFLHDLEDFRIVRGDTLRDPRFVERSGLRTFDVVVANPPFSLKNWGADTWASDPYGRAFCGVPPGGTADLAWVQHMVTSMRAQTGRVGVVMPHGVLFRGGVERTIRRCLVQDDRLEAVIGLPGNLFYSTPIPACLLVFKQEKTIARRGTVVFIDGSAQFSKGGNQNYMDPGHIEAILAAYRSDARENRTNVPVCSVPHATIEEHRWDLSLSRYLKTTTDRATNVEEAIRQLGVAQTEISGKKDRVVPSALRSSIIRLAASSESSTITTLGAVADYQNGYPFKPKELGLQGLPVIRIRQLLNPSDIPDRTTVVVDARHHISDGDLIFSWSGTLAVRIWDRGPAILNQHLFRVIERKGVDRRWLALALEAAIEDLEKKMHGTTMRHITKSDLLPHPMALPSPAYQKQMVELVEAVHEESERGLRLAEAAYTVRSGLLHEFLSGAENGSSLHAAPSGKS